MYSDPNKSNKSVPGTYLTAPTSRVAVSEHLTGLLVAEFS